MERAKTIGFFNFYFVFEFDVEQFVGNVAHGLIQLHYLWTYGRGGTARTEVGYNRPSTGGRPRIVFHGKAAEFAEQLGGAHVALSISHTADQAIAQVILET